MNAKDLRAIAWAMIVPTVVMFGPPLFWLTSVHPYAAALGHAPSWLLPAGDWISYALIVFGGIYLIGSLGMVIRDAKLRRLDDVEQPGSAAQEEEAGWPTEAKHVGFWTPYSDYWEARTALCGYTMTREQALVWNNCRAACFAAYKRTLARGALAAEPVFHRSSRQLHSVESATERGECSSIGSQGCTYSPGGPNGAMQCVYCGRAQPRARGVDG